jgi:IS4 transposase
MLDKRQLYQFSGKNVEEGIDLIKYLDTYNRGISLFNQMQMKNVSKTEESPTKITQATSGSNTPSIPQQE